MGLHLRSCLYVAEVGVKYFPEVIRGNIGCHIVAVNLETGKDANAKSVLQLGKLESTFGSRMQFISLMDEKLWEDFTEIMSLLFYESIDHDQRYRGLEKVFSYQDPRGLFDRRSLIDRLSAGGQSDGAKLFFEPIGEDAKAAPSPRVFVSANSRDLEYARQLFDYLIVHGIDAFLAQVSIPASGNTDFQQAIEQALAECDHLVVVASSPEYADAPWVRMEWSIFINEINSRRKRGNLATLLAGGLTIDDLPIPLRRYQSEELTPAGLDRLLHFLLAK